MLMLFVVFGVVYVANEFLTHSAAWYVAEFTAGILAGMLVVSILPNIFRLSP